MALPPIVNRSVKSLATSPPDDGCFATNAPRTGAVVARELAAQRGDDPTVQSLESYKENIRGSRVQPPIMRYPFDIGSAKSEIPHIMQFKIYWRWENPEFAKAAQKLKMESESTLKEMQSAQWLLEESNYNMDELMRWGGIAPTSEIANATVMLLDPAYVNPQDPSKNTNLNELLSNPETREEGRRIMERNLRNADDRVSSISSEFGSNGETNFGATPVTQDSNILSGRFNKLLAQATPEGLQKGLEYLGLQQRDPQYDQMVSIYLPVCTRINNEDAFAYNDYDMKLASGAMAAVASLKNGDSIATQIGELSKQAAIAAATVAVQNSALAGVVPSITGLVLNPRVEKMFQQKDIRQFTFSWDFYPRNEVEVKNIKDIIDTFRYHSHPARSGKGDVSGNNAITNDPQIMLRVPAEFTVKFLSSESNGSGNGFVENEYIPKLSRCVVTNISVDYTPNGVFSTLKDNSPSAYTLSITFSEVAQLTREDVEAGF